MANKARIGDVVEIPVKHGAAYAQFSHFHKKYNALLRILPGKYKTKPPDMTSLVSERELFSIFFPLQTALDRKIVRVVGNFPVPEFAKKFPLFRTGVVDPTFGKVKIWWLWDGDKEWRVGDLSPEQRSLSLRGIWNDTLLIKRIEEGWTPETDTM